MKTSFSLLFLCLTLPLMTAAQGVTISASGIPTTFHFEVTARSTSRDTAKPDGLEIARFHSDHIFGIFNSALYATEFGFPQELNEGSIGTKSPKLTVLEVFQKPNDPYWWVHYQADGEALVMRQVIAGWKRSGRYDVKLPMVTNLPEIYQDDLEDFRNSKWKKCSDPDFPKAIDFSYFYDPFRCKELGRSPLGETVEFQFKIADSSGDDAEFPTEELVGDNGNGKLQVAYFAMGFNGELKKGSTDSKIKRDDGYRIYKTFAETVVKKFGFMEMESEGDFKKALGSDRAILKLQSPVSMDHLPQRRFYKTFVKDEGHRILVIRLGLFDSQNMGSDLELKSFTSFWHEAWANGDLIYYGGHSGDGIALTHDDILGRLDQYELFPKPSVSNKMQVGFLDGCSTYAYYQDMYRELMPQNLNLITYGMVSLYHAGSATLDRMMTEFINEDERRPWFEVLRDIEKAQLLPHYQFLHGDAEGERLAKRSARQDLYPSFMLNVWVP